MRMQLEDLHKRLELADLMLQQVRDSSSCYQSASLAHVLTTNPFFFSLFLFLQYSNQSDPSSANQQVQLLMEEKQQLEAHNHQVCVHKELSLRLHEYAPASAEGSFFELDLRVLALSKLT